MQPASESASVTAHSPTSTSSERRGLLLARLTIAGILLYIVLDVIVQLLPPHYSAISQAESDLAVGPYGYLMAINFVVRGLVGLALLGALIESGAKERFLWPGLILVGIWAVGALLLALFPTDLAGETPTLHGKLHLAIALLAFLCAPIGSLLLSRALVRIERLRSLAQPGVVIAILTFIALLLLGSTARLRALRDAGGLLERMFIGLVLLWMLVAAFQLIRTLQAKR